MAVMYRDLLMELFVPLCVHDDRFHLQLAVGGTVRGEELMDCVLTMFITDKRFLPRELSDRFYQRFLVLWSSCSLQQREALNFTFKRIVMTKQYFLFLSYIYLLYCLHEISGVVSFLRFEQYDAFHIHQNLSLYPGDKLNTLLENVNFTSLNDLHRFLFRTDLRLPISTQISSPCLSLLRSKKYDTSLDIIVYQDNVWQRRQKSRTQSVEDLISALRRRAGQVPCGNPVYVVAKYAVENFCVRCPRYLVPLRGLSLNDDGTRMQRSESHAEPSKIVMHGLSIALRRGLIGSVLELPVWCFCVLKCERYLSVNSLVAVVCRYCGHCLNLGKEKLQCDQNFPLNSMFYYRDRQEKSVIYDTNAELIHCSLCGSQRLTKERVYEASLEDVYGFRCLRVQWKAVVGLNAACAVYDREAVLDVIVPCSSRTCDSTTILRLCTAARLLKLVTHGSAFLCQRCQAAVEPKDTCLDDETCENRCLACAVVARLPCQRRYV
ncbi:protein UL49 [Saimiriine betaherpesvirus 4]|uniref:Protein UL49 n=1 Tax=Saimiriine betaherpesvirus 4 TaxID=1535247 RepID=G8XSW4_9BETA|nr:protein UL49 [Saimiriine betaherpesvirus 4]AEV80910.1 protein UL49 [Saimiriine betaherpesvirus 4]